MTAYFKPADYKHRARDELHACKQGKSSVVDYIDAFKRAAQKVDKISDEEKLDKFLRGLAPHVYMELLRKNPKTFNTAVLLAERMQHMHEFMALRDLWYGAGLIPQRGNPQNKGKQRANDPKPMDIDTLQARNA